MKLIKAGSEFYINIDFVTSISSYDGKICSATILGTEVVNINREAYELIKSYGKA